MRNSQLLNLPVHKIMVTNIHAIAPNDTLAEAERLMLVHRIHHIPVVDELGEIKGIISKKDIELIKDWGTTIGLPSAFKKNEQLLNSNLAGEKMTKILVTVSPDDNLKLCYNIFKKNNFHALPVCEDKKLVGIITTYDMLKAAYGNHEIKDTLELESITP